MKCLALETTTDVSSVALADESGLIAEYNLAHRMDLSRRLMPNIVALLKDCGLVVKDVEAIGVSIGPGSFTGLRIGVTTAKTLAQVLGVPIAGIVTLDLLAHQFDYLPDALVCPLIKVRKGEVYHAFFRARRGSVERISDYAAGPINEVIEYADRLKPVSPDPQSEIRNPKCENPQSAIRNPQSKIIFCGDALPENLDALTRALGDRVIAAPPWLSYPKASILARLVLEKITRGEADDPLTLVPFYIRPSAPELRAGCPGS
jgi:tRNA threonylcarbamoyladenosine biosynthesis protein TsaB